ncbi:MAG: HAD family hydrolase [Peptoniphilaceae bacterium]|nr:HAD family hydrolase [Peptoniphilaceae bacterium]MDY6018407.1 HAD family hydrolase [Anaerococcus sp.]
MIKLFAFDLDGTILNSRSIMDKKTIAALNKLEENGIIFVFASGRVTSSVSYLMDKTAIDNPFVANNGAVSFLNKDTLLKENYLDTDILKKLIAFANKKNLYYHFYDLSTFYSEYLVEDRIRHLIKEKTIGLKYQVNISIAEDPLARLMENKAKALKFQMFVDEDSAYFKNDLIEELKNDFGQKIYITSSANSLIEIMASGVSKWQAVLDIAQNLGIKNNEIAAIGDQDNDYLMVKNAQIGFAMGNASQELKNIADIIVASNDDFGVFFAIEKVLEINKNV